MNKTPVKIRGITLVEMMIAMVISLFLLAGVVQIFVSSKQSYRTAEDASRLQENGRFAIDIMARDIRMAGFLPCRIQAGEVANSIDSTDEIYDFFTQSIGADEGGVSAFAGYPAVGTGVGRRVAGSDAIRILRGGSESACVESHVPNAASLHLCDDSDDFEKGDFLLVCDADKAALMQMSGPASAPPHNVLVHNTGAAGISPGNCSKFLGKASTTGDCSTNTATTFGPDSQVVKFNSISYYIGVGTNLRDTDDDGVGDYRTNSLYRIDNVDDPTQAIELVEDVETMQLLYGEDTDGDGIADQYRTGNTIVDPNAVVAVRIGLLIKSPNEIVSADDTKTYSVAGTPIADTGTAVTHGGDRRLRRVYTATIKVRNRGIL